MIYRQSSLLRLVALLVASLMITFASARADYVPQIRVAASDDFEFQSGNLHPAWEAAEWISLNQRPAAAHEYTSRFKTLYSEAGIYFLFDGTDQRLTATMQDDFDDLWKEDVFEVFLWTDENNPIYFEYEISPLGKELPILVPNFDGKFLGWRPWNFEGERKTRTQVTIRGGTQEPGTAIKGWSAEVFIPYVLLSPLKNVPPKAGTQWRANVYRVDYDEQQMTQWDWSRVGLSFHEFRKFGMLTFE